VGNFDAILSQFGVEIEWLQYVDGSYVSKGNVKAILQPARIEQTLIEPGFTIDAYYRVYTNVDLAVKDRVVFQGKTWEVLSAQLFESSVLGEKYVAATVRRLLA
jgi:hypothetical protein